MNDVERHRKNFAQSCAVIGGLVTFVSLIMTYSVFTESFIDWPPAARRIFTLACCGAIEGTAAALIYGLVYALTGWTERIVAFLGLIFVGGVMCVNLITHSMQVRQIPLESWQQEYLAWAGPTVLIGIFAIIVLLSIVRFETRILKGEREIELGGILASLQAQKQWVESDDFNDFLNQHKQAYFKKISQRLGLGAATTQSEPAQESLVFPKAHRR